MVLCVSTAPETAHLAKTLWLLGCMLASITFGILLMLARSCLQALYKRKNRNPYVNRGLAIYVWLVIVIATGTEIIAIRDTLYGVLDETCVGPYLHVFQPYFGPPDIFNFLIALLTDSLLVSTVCALEYDGHSYFRLGGATLSPPASGGLGCYG